MRDSEPRLLARSVQERMGLTLVPEQFGGQPFLVPAGPVLHDGEQVLQEPLRLVDVALDRAECRIRLGPIWIAHARRPCAGTHGQDATGKELEHETF